MFGKWLTLNDVHHNFSNGRSFGGLKLLTRTIRLNGIIHPMMKTSHNDPQAGCTVYAFLFWDEHNEHLAPFRFVMAVNRGIHTGVTFSELLMGCLHYMSHLGEPN